MVADFRLNIKSLLSTDKSQFGEQEIVIKHILNKKPQGYFLEIGAFQPVTWSNSFVLRSKWAGLSIDANSKVKVQWRIFRPKSNFASFAVVTDPLLKYVDFYRFPRRFAVFNSTNKSFLDTWSNLGHSPKKYSVVAVDVNKLYSETMKTQGNIDFLMLDVEGEDFSLLEALFINQSVLPTWILVEDHYGQVDILVRRYGYKLLEKSGPSNLYFK